MVKHLLNEKDAGKNVIYKGHTYRSSGRTVELPEAVEMFNPVLTEQKTEKEKLIDKALELKVGAKSALKRLSIETLKERIEEAL